MLERFIKQLSVLRWRVVLNTCSLLFIHWKYTFVSTRQHLRRDPAFDCRVIHSHTPTSQTKIRACPHLRDQAVMMTKTLKVWVTFNALLLIFICPEFLNIDNIIPPTTESQRRVTQVERKMKKEYWRRWTLTDVRVMFRWSLLLVHNKSMSRKWQQCGSSAKVYRSSPTLGWSNVKKELNKLQDSSAEMCFHSHRVSKERPSVQLHKESINQCSKPPSVCM